MAVSVAVPLIKGSPGKGKERGIRKCPSHIQSKEAILSSMGFIGQDDDILGL
jgi:hypothetical protein